MKRGFWFISIFLLVLLLLSQGSVAAVDTAASAESEEIFLPTVLRSGSALGAIQGPLLVDGQQGRIYSEAQVDGISQTVVLATGDGQLLDAFSPAGLLALDRTQQRLLVDQGEDGVAVLDALDGERLGTLPTTGEATAAPQVDPDLGRAFVFRESTILVFDLGTEALLETIPLSLTLSVCDEPEGPAPISRAYYDLIGDVLYVSSTTYVCTPFVEETIVSYDAALLPVAEFERPARYQAVPFAGNLYGTSVLRGYDPFGLSYWALNASREWYNQTIAGSNAELKGIVVDWQRSLLYEAVWEYPDQGAPAQMIRVSSTADRALQHTVPWEALGLGDAQLAGHDPHSDQLYFLEDGVLRILPTAVLLPDESL